MNFIDCAAPFDSGMPSDDEVPRVVTVSREVAAGAALIFELIADPEKQPRWDGNNNLAEAAPGQRIRCVGDVFVMTLAKGASGKTTSLSSTTVAALRGCQPNRDNSRPDICGVGSSTRSTHRAHGSHIPTTGPT